MNTINGTLVPTELQLRAALDTMREQLGARLADSRIGTRSLQEWDLPDIGSSGTGPRVIVMPVQNAWNSWMVWLRVHCPARTVFREVRLDTDRMMSLARLEERAAVQTYLRRMCERWGLIDSIPALPLGLPVFLEPLVVNANRLFRWTMQDGNYLLRIGDVARFLLSEATGRSVPDDLEEEAIDAAVSACCGLSGPAVSILTGLQAVNKCRVAWRAQPFVYLHQQLTALMETGVALPQDCPSSETLARQTCNALIATAALCKEEK